MSDRRWQEVVLADFQQLRAGGVSHIHMAEFEHIFAGEPPVDDGTATDSPETAR